MTASPATYWDKVRYFSGQFHTTEQELFDHILAHIREQGAPASTEVGDCRYRLPIGERILSCAVGCLVTDEEYALSWDQGVHLDDLKLPVRLRSFQASGFLHEMQRIHDGAAEAERCEGIPFLPGFERTMREYAIEHKLTYVAPGWVSV